MATSTGRAAHSVPRLQRIPLHSADAARIRAAFITHGCPCTNHHPDTGPLLQSVFGSGTETGRTSATVPGTSNTPKRR